MRNALKDPSYDGIRKNEILARGEYEDIDYIVKDLGTHPTAYVRCPEEYLKFKEEDIPVTVHGGVTFKGSLTGEKGIWIGWDYAHIGDYYASNFLDMESEGTKHTTKELIKECKSAVHEMNLMRNYEPEIEF